MKNIFGYDRLPVKEIFDPSLTVMDGRDPEAHRLASIKYWRAIEPGPEERSWLVGPWTVWLRAGNSDPIALPPGSSLDTEPGYLTLRIPLPWGNPTEIPTP
jgi:hypothetical protein